jgi:hypothetical protein
MKQVHLILILALIGVTHATPAEGHSPYIKKVLTVKSPAGDPLIIEKLYGDGIFFADPVRLQIRNKNGVVLAYSRTNTHGGVFCPSVRFCWAFPYDGLLAEPLKLDYENLKFDESNKDGLPADLAAYMAGLENTARSSTFAYPSYKDEPKNFIVFSPLIKLLSPIIIIADNFLTFLILAAVYCLPSFLFPTFWSFSLSKTGASQFVLIFLGILMAIPFGVLTVGVTFIDLFTLSIPFLYGLLIASLSIWAGLLLSRKCSHRLLSNSHTDWESRKK